MAKTLTDKGIGALKPADKRQEIPAGVAGLVLIVQPSGVMSWALRYRFAGKVRKLTLGRYSRDSVNGYSLADARQAANEALEQVGRGEDPRWAKQEEKAARLEGRNKVCNLLDEFEKRHLSKLKSRKQARGFLDRYVLGPWGERDVQTITRRDVIDLVEDVADSGRGVTANRVLAHTRKFLNWCVERTIIEFNPAIGVKPPVKEKSRDRVLSDEEIRWFWQACEEEGKSFEPIGKLLLLTGQREDEVAAMTNAEIDDGILELSPSRTKNGRPHAVPLPKAAQAILDQVQPDNSDGDHLFSNTKGRTPFSGFSKKQREIRACMNKAAGRELEHWSFHDLRRTCETGMARLGVRQEIIDRVTSHVTGLHKMARTYNKYDYLDEKREALELWAQAVEDILAGLDPVEEAKKRRG